MKKEEKILRAWIIAITRVLVRKLTHRSFKRDENIKRQFDAWALTSSVFKEACDDLREHWPEPKAIGRVFKEAQIYATTGKVDLR